MFSSNKILSIIFILLFLVLIGEVIYFITIGQNKVSQSKNTPKTEALTPVVSPSPITNSPLLTEEQKKIIDSVKEGSAAAYLNNFKNTSKRKVSLIIEQTGFIGDITYDKNNENIYFKILDDENKKIVTFILDPINLPKTTFYKIENNGQILIGVNDVKKGDKIMIRIIGGITEDTNQSEFYIYEK